MKHCPLLLLLLMTSLSLSAAAQDACQDSCSVQKSECRKEAERTAQSDADIPFWAANRKSGATAFSKHNTPSDPFPYQMREDNFLNRRSQGLALCEDRHRTCLVSCKLHKPDNQSRNQPQP